MDVSKKTKSWAIFSCFLDPKFFSKMTLLGLILCGESIARISNASLILSQRIGICVLKGKFLDFLPDNDFLGGKFMRELIARIPGA